MVEAVGIEPTSESLQRQNLQAYPVSLITSGRRLKPANKPAGRPLSKFLDGSLRESKAIENPT